MTENQGLLSGGWNAVTRNKRYILWFWLLNLTLAEFGTAVFRKSAHAILDHSLAAVPLMRGFSIGTVSELLGRPEFGSMASMTAPAMYFAFLFFLATALFLPGVFQAYASTYRLPREDFFRACGRNLWRFIRLMIVAGIVMGIFAGVLFGINGAIVDKAGESTNEVLPFQLQMTGLAVIFLIMTVLRIWFDLAEADVVLSDQRAVRKSIWTGLRHTFRGLGRLLTSYVVAALAGVIVLVGGIGVWMKFVSPESILGAFLVGQFTLLLLLIPRFWQRGIAVAYWRQNMMVPVVQLSPGVTMPAETKPAELLPVAVAAEPAPIITDLPPAAQGS